MFALPRPFAGEPDLEKMQALLMAGKRWAGHSIYVHVGDLVWWLFYLLRQHDLGQIAWLWDAEPPGADLLGWALFSPQYAAFDLFVHPRERESQRAEQMLGWTEARARQIAQERGHKQVSTTWVFEDDLWLKARLEQLGLARREEHSFYLVRPLDSAIAGPQLPAGFRLGHVTGEADLEERVWASYQAFNPGSQLEKSDLASRVQAYLGLTRAPGYDPELDVVALAPDGRIAAFALGWLDPLNRVGEFEPVGTRPDFQGQGLGRAVLLEGLRRMQARGATAAIVYVEFDNSAAQRLYESLGFQIVNRIYTYVKAL